MYNTSLELVDHVQRDLIAIGTDYSQGFVLGYHKHRRAQLLYGVSGLMEVDTDHGAWIVPPFAAVWIPAGELHRVRMLGVSTRSVYIEPRASPRRSSQCEVLAVTRLLHELLLTAMDLPVEYEVDGRDGHLVALLLCEIGSAPAMPLFAPIPACPTLSTMCRGFLASPDVASSPVDWARMLNQSPRTFARFFRRQTGMTFRAWRQQACMMTALSRLSAGQSVTSVALSLGYASPSAFSTRFRETLGFRPADIHDP